MEVLEGEVLEFRLQPFDTEPVREGRIDVEGLLRDLLPVSRGTGKSRVRMLW